MHCLNAATKQRAARRVKAFENRAHGFFNSMIGMELRRLGWRCVKGRGWRYWSTRYFER